MFYRRNEEKMGSKAFELSRVYGQGWNAAKQLLADDSGDPGPKRAAALNPYQALDERTRWNKGFEEGLLSRTGGHAMANFRSWRPERDK
jgi:hypothetical protein